MITKIIADKSIVYRYDFQAFKKDFGDMLFSRYEKWLPTTKRKMSFNQYVFDIWVSFFYTDKETGGMW